MKKILIIDDSTLMRRVLSDIINESRDFRVLYTATDGIAGLKILEEHDDVDAIFLDIHMPKMGGIEFLEVLKKKNIETDVFVFSSIATQDGEETMRALELGALEFIKKPTNILSKRADFKYHVFRLLDMLSEKDDGLRVKNSLKKVEPTKVKHTSTKNKSGSGKLVAIACSTGGPKALQSIIPFLPENLNAPVLIVQHMPKGFTESLAKRLNELSKITVKESVDGEELQNGVCYIAKGGCHLLVESKNGKSYAKHSSAEPVTGLRPYANYMYDSLCNVNYGEIICVVLTGMGADGTAGIKKLDSARNIYVIAQDADSSTVYGMPRAVAEAGLVDEVHTLLDVSNAIIKKIGVN